MSRSKEIDIKSTLQEINTILVKNNINCSLEQEINQIEQITKNLQQFILQISNKIYEMKIKVNDYDDSQLSIPSSKNYQVPPKSEININKIEIDTFKLDITRTNLSDNSMETISEKENGITSITDFDDEIFYDPDTNRMISIV